MTHTHTHYIYNSYFREFTGKSEEVLFPARHVPHKPWEPFEWKDNPPPLKIEMEQCFQNVKVPIITLSHITHNKEFEDICQQDEGAYTLRSSRKVGKTGYSYDGPVPRSIGNSFVACDCTGLPNEESEYCYVRPGEALLPGSYIWWSIEIPAAYKHYKYGVSNQFLLPKQSRYGSQGIFAEVNSLLQSYQASLLSSDASVDDIFPMIELRIGGTLRYKKEVCNVIIVCAENEPSLPFEKYPLWGEGKNKIKFDPDNCKILSTLPMYIMIKNGIDYGDNWSWDQTVFAFHFPNDVQVMKCSKARNFEHKHVEHKRGICIKTQPGPKNKYEWLCPDELKTRKRSSYPICEMQPETKKQNLSF